MRWACRTRWSCCNRSSRRRFEPPRDPSRRLDRRCPPVSFAQLRSAAGRGGDRSRRRAWNQPSSGEFGGGAVTRLFCNELGSSEHPAFRSWRASGSPPTPSSIGPAASPSTYRFSTAPGTRGNPLPRPIRLQRFFDRHRTGGDRYGALRAEPVRSAGGAGAGRDGPLAGGAAREDRRTLGRGAGTQDRSGAGVRLGGAPAPPLPALTGSRCLPSARARSPSSDSSLPDPRSFASLAVRRARAGFPPA